MREGIVYLFGNRTMVGVLLCLSVVQLGIGAIHVVWVPFMQRTFGVGAEGLGAVDVAQGVGMALGGLGLGLMANRFRNRELAGWSILFCGAMITLIGLAARLASGEPDPAKDDGPEPPDRRVSPVAHAPMRRPTACCCGSIRQSR
jgi:predicted MFS family arabinose efflux permease